MPDYVSAIIALADHLAGLTPPLRRSVSGGGKIELFAIAADEASAASPWSVLRPYQGADVGYRPVGAMSLQLLTVGSSDRVALTRAQALHDRLLDALGRPVRNLVLAGCVLYGVVNLRGPGKVGQRENGLVEYASNMDVFFRAA